MVVIFQFWAQKNKLLAVARLHSDTCAQKKAKILVETVISNQVTC